MSIGSLVSQGVLSVVGLVARIAVTAVNVGLVLEAWMDSNNRCNANKYTAHVDG